jgi:bifunctional oligoribonuclease and PAP phosphatase NrnA
MPHDPVMPSSDWREIGNAIDRHHRFLITTHVNPDGDGLGAELGLSAYLESLQKDVRIINPDGLPARYRFLDREAKYESYDPALHESFIEGCEVVIVLDISRWERLDALGERLRRRRGLTICIDHHPFESNGMANLYGVDLSAAATGQLVYEMVRDAGRPLDRRMALGFYISILTDTGSFRFSNSDPRAHRAAAELLAYALDPNEIYEQVYGNSSLPRLRLLGKALSELRTEEDGRIVLLVLPQAWLRETGAVPADTEGFVDIARSAADCESVALFLEREDGKVKLSLRSRGRMNVNRVAAQFGGGGHILASGGTHPGPLSRAVDEVTRALREELARASGTPPSGNAPLSQ